MYPVKSFAPILCLALLLSCAPPDKQHQLPPETYHALKSRFTCSDPMSEAQLESWLRDQTPAGSTIQELHVSSVIMGHIPITEGRIVWKENNGYVALLVTDYAADSSSYFTLFQRYLQASPPVPDPLLSWAGDYAGFAWTWQESRTPIYYLEAGLFDRLHVRWRSNFPQEESFLSRAGSENNWNSIFSPAALP